MLIVKAPSPSVKPTSQPWILSLSCWLSALGIFSLYIYEYYTNMFSNSRYFYSSFPRERSFQHIAKFNYGSALTYHRILIVKTAVHPSLDPKLLSILRQTFTSGFNLRALGTRRPLYFLLRVKQRPVFLLNSRLNHFCAPAFACARAGILFPKLRM